MINIGSVFFYSCKTAVELVEKEQVVGLSLFESIRLRAHLKMCSSCSRYAVESESLDHTLQTLSALNRSEITLTKEQKQKLIEQISKTDN